MRTGRGPDGREGAAEGRGRVGVDAGDALRRLAGLQRLGRGEVVEAAPGMGLDVGDAAGLGGEPRQELGQHDVLVQVGGPPAW